jgi:hypothetical protein
VRGVGFTLRMQWAFRKSLFSPSFVLVASSFYMAQKAFMKLKKL